MFPKTTRCRAALTTPLSVAFAVLGLVLCGPAARTEESSLSWQERCTLTHGGYLSAVAFAPDGKMLASASADANARCAVILWRTGTGMEDTTLKEQPGVFSLRYSPDGKILVMGTTDKIILWDVGKGRERASLPGHQGMVEALDITAEGKLLASAGSSTLKLWDLGKEKEVADLSLPNKWYHSVAFSPDRKTVAAATGDPSELSRPGEVMLWDVATGKVRGTLLGHRGQALAVAFAPDGKTLASAGFANPFGRYSGQVFLWDAKTQEQGKEFVGEERGAMRALAFSPDGKMLACGSDDGSIRIWDPDTKDLLALLKGHNKGVDCLAFSPDSKLLASGSRDETVKIWAAAPKK